MCVWCVHVKVHSLGHLSSPVHFSISQWGLWVVCRDMSSFSNDGPISSLCGGQMRLSLDGKHLERKWSHYRTHRLLTCQTQENPGSPQSSGTNVPESLSGGGPSLYISPSGTRPALVFPQLLRAGTSLMCKLTVRQLLPQEGILLRIFWLFLMLSVWIACSYVLPIFIMCLVFFSYSFFGGPFCFIHKSLFLGLSMAVTFSHPVYISTLSSSSCRFSYNQIHQLFPLWFLRIVPGLRNPPCLIIVKIVS